MGQILVKYSNSLIVLTGFLHGGYKFSLIVFASSNCILSSFSLFESSLKHNLFVHPRFLKTIEEKKKQIKKSMTPAQYETIVEIISSKKNPIQVLRNLNDTQVFSELFPEFGRVWGQVQFDIYHHYTTDCLLYTSPSPRDMRRSRMPSSA